MMLLEVVNLSWLCEDSSGFCACRRYAGGDSPPRRATCTDSDLGIFSLVDIHPRLDGRRRWRLTSLCGGDLAVCRQYMLCSALLARSHEASPTFVFLVALLV